MLIKDNIKCPFCHSDNTELITNQSHLAFNYKKVEGNTTTDGKRFYPLRKSICLDCSMVFEYMEKELLNAYKEDKPYLY